MDKQSIDWRERSVACVAADRILPGESPDDYHQTWQTWLGEYLPETDSDIELLTAVVDAAWRVQRTGKAFTAVERALATGYPDAAQWPAAQILHLSRVQRYHAMAEASLHRNLRLVEFMKARTEQREKIAAATHKSWVDTHPNEAAAARKADAEVAVAAVLKSGGKSNPKKEGANLLTVAPQSRAQQLFSGQNHTKKRKKIVRLEQWVEVRIVDGKTVTQLYPANEKVMERGKGMLPPPEFVYRRLNFPDGIPPEYNWVGISDAEHRERGGMGIQRMTVETWLDLIEAEAKRGDGHINPTANLPRPEEHGGCDCPVCTRNRELLEAQPDAA